MEIVDRQEEFPLFLCSYCQSITVDLQWFYSSYFLCTLHCTSTSNVLALETLYVSQAAVMLIGIRSHNKENSDSGVREMNTG